MSDFQAKLLRVRIVGKNGANLADLMSRADAYLEVPRGVDTALLRVAKDDLHAFAKLLTLIQHSLRSDKSVFEAPSS